MQGKKLKIVYVVSKRAGKRRWNRVGIAFENRDGSLSVKLEAFPVHGELHICDYVPLAEHDLPTGESYELSA